MDKKTERYKELRNKKVRLTPFTVENISDTLNGTERDTSGRLEKNEEVRSQKQLDKSSE